MDVRDLHDKGLKLRREMFGDAAVEQRMNAFRRVRRAVATRIASRPTC